MTDDKHSTKHKILGELESIKSLLDDEDAALPDEAADLPGSSTEDDIPLLTETLDEVVRDIEGDEENQADQEWLESDQNDIPVLHAAVEEDRDPPKETEDLPNPTPRDKHATAGGSESATNPMRENQPSLFDQGDPTSSPDAILDADDLQPAPADSAKPASPGRARSRTDRSPEWKAPGSKAPPRPQGNSLSPKPATENPFLPKHIRDRLHANRTNQQEMLDSFLNSSHPVQAGGRPDSADKASAGKAKAASTEDDLVDEMLQLYLPRIEAELRKRIRAIVEKEQKALSQTPQD